MIGEKIAQSMTKSLIECYKTGKSIVVVIDNGSLLKKNKPIIQSLEEIVLTYKELAQPMNYTIKEEIRIGEDQSEVIISVLNKNINNELSTKTSECSNIIQFNEIGKRLLKKRDAQLRR